MAQQVPKNLAEVFLDFWTFRQAIQFAGLLLVCVLTVYSAISAETETAASAKHQVTLTISNLTNGAVFPNLSRIRGTVCSSGSPVEGVLVQLRELSRSREISCVAKLGVSARSATCQSELSWTATLPRLRDGRHEVTAQALLDEGVRPASVRRTIVIDGTSPDISFFPLHDQQAIADFSEVGGEIDEVAAIEFSICRFDDTAEQKSYWNGTAWSTNRNDPSIKIRAGSVGDLWFASEDTALPKAADIPAGNYLISAFAIDRAGNEGRAAVTVVKKTVAFSAKVEPRSDE
jgi:hypothetical protein